MTDGEVVHVGVQVAACIHLVLSTWVHLGPLGYRCDGCWSAEFAAGFGSIAYGVVGGQLMLLGMVGGQWCSYGQLSQQQQQLQGMEGACCAMSSRFSTSNINMAWWGAVVSWQLAQLQQQQQQQQQHQQQQQQQQ